MRRHIRIAGIFGLLLASWQPASAHEGDLAAEQELTQAYSGRQIATGSPNALDVVAEIIHLASSHIESSQGGPLLPADTHIDRVAWKDNVCEIDLTFELIPDGWRLSALDLESLTNALHRPFVADPHFGGTQVRARGGENDEYGTLEQFSGDAAAELSKLTAQRLFSLEMAFYKAIALAGGPFRGAPDMPRDAGDAMPPTGGESTPRGGPSGSAARQPVGALTGVTVYCSAGHGWTAGASAWILQRPVLNSMCEDYGNLDQLNYFAAYAFNAGATVVPLRPVGWQPIEIVLDNDDPGVTYSGSWSNNTTGPKYYENGVTNSGVAYRFATAAASETAVATYTPTIVVSGHYPVYCFTPSGSNRVRQTYRIGHSGGTSEVTIDHRETGGGWVWLGEYFFEAGGANFVAITNASTDSGVVVADAIRWGGGFGDLSRPGPNSISGYPRDEEAQRYWGHSQWGSNAVGFDSSIWDVSGSDDQSDNVGTGARIAREMNEVPAGGVNVDRWKRVHLEFHTNAFDTNARGQMCLTTDLGATTNQAAFATTLSNEVDADLTLRNGEFETAWYDRAGATLSGSYGAIATTNNSNEFDATLIELAFHDNVTDAQLLRDPRMRQAMAQACVHGITKFLHSLAGSPVPLAFAPDTPREPRVLDLGGGDVQIDWAAPLTDGARGDPATGYVIYTSSNGLGFGNPIVLGNVTSHTVTGVPVGETRYYRIAATNAGGESMPTEVLAVRRPAAGTANVLIVNGFDRLRRQTNPIQTFTQPPAYAGQSIEREIWRQSNSYDYVIEHGVSLAANGEGFASCANEAVASGAVLLTGYEIVDWILGTESAEDLTFSTTEQTAVTNYLNAAGRMFVSGADLAYDLVGANHGSSFAQNTLRINYGVNDSNSYAVTPTANGLLAGLANFNFDPAGGAAYDAREPDTMTTRPDSRSCINYVGGTGGIAGLQYSSGVYNVVAFAFPFETISSPSVRDLVMQRVLNYLRTATGPLMFDFDNDADVDFNDFNSFVFCFRGPGLTYPPGQFCLEGDPDGDLDLDMQDFKVMQRIFTGPP
ncbi:MAG: N-acetylmuramoyl-L-alanine amidase [Planctomycetes bacterium]|nr:N-acetylmuramoyl-L-alanine amidase [Planctomycetota bacterium]